jgi:hypothetical protein
LILPAQGLLCAADGGLRQADDRVAKRSFRPLRHGADLRGDEALAIANATNYGLGAGWTAISRAHNGARYSLRYVLGQQLQAHQSARPSAASASPATGAKWATRLCTTTEARSVWVNVDAQIAFYKR